MSEIRKPARFRRVIVIPLCAWMLASICSPLGCAGAQDISVGRREVPNRPRADRRQAPSAYVLGPEDQISISVAEVGEISNDPVRIDLTGFIRVPLIGRIHAGGLTIEQFEAELATRLKPYVLEPDVTVAISEFRSQPVSVFGAVKNPGVYQVQGRKTLLEMISQAGGLDTTAGYRISITRRVEWGRIPLASAAESADGQFSVGEVSVKSLVQAKAPEENIPICPHDVISVPRAEMIYVVGTVQRSGGFVLSERETMSVLQALSLAGGLDRFASGRNARILRRSGGADRAEIAVNVPAILMGRANDVPLQAEDILFIPSSAPKKAVVRALEAAIQTGTGVVIWGRHP